MIVAIQRHDVVEAILGRAASRSRNNTWDTTITIDVTYAKVNPDKPIGGWLYPGTKDIAGRNDFVPQRGFIRVFGHLGTYRMISLTKRDKRVIAKYHITSKGATE